MTTGDRAEAGQRLAWGWLAHLRSGGTTAWAEWLLLPEAAPGVPGRALPGAQQLELLRRLNQVGRPSPALVERVLDASAAGRGSPDLELVGAAVDSRFGPRPVDPARLPTAELLRVATALIAEELAGMPLAEPRLGRLAWRRGLRVVGDPAIASPARARLAASRRPPRRAAPVVVVGAPLAQMLGDAWVERCFAVGAPAWPAWLAGLEQHRRVPPRIDLPRVAAGWTRRAGAGAVTVMLDPAATARRLGVQPEPGPSADAAELARRVAPVLGLMVPPPRRARLLGEVLRPGVVALVGGRAALSGGPGAVGPGAVGAARPGIPEQRLEWVGRRARRMAESLSRGDYPVVGDPRQVLPTEVPGATPSGAGALDLAIRVLGAGLAERGEGTG